MSFKIIQKNIAANLAGTAVTSISAVITAPLLFRLLGAEAYGLVGLYLLLQSILPLFDAGLTAGLSRAVAWHNGLNEAGKAKTLIFYAHFPLTILIIIFLLIILTGSSYFIDNWGEGTENSGTNLHHVILLISAALGLRMYTALNRAALMALEFQVKSNTIQAIAACSRTLGALCFAYFTRTGIIGFFVLQPLISLFEWLAYRYVLGRVFTVESQAVENREIKKHLRFSLYIAGLSLLWVFTSQIEKMYLTSNLSLASYGAYALGVQISSVVLLAVATIHGATLPRLTRYASNNELQKIRKLYGTTTVFTIALASTITIGIYLTSKNITPSLALPVNGISPIQVACIYSVGNCALAIMTLAYHLQNALGVMRLHTVGAIVSAVIQIPLLIWAASTGDVIRTAITFAVINWLLAAFWLQVVHTLFLPGGALSWIKEYFGPSALMAVSTGLLSTIWVNHIPPGLFWGTATLLIGCSITFLASLTINASAREILVNWRKHYD